MDQKLDYLKLNTLKYDYLPTLNKIIEQVTVDDLISVQEKLFEALQVDLVFVGDVNAVNAINESKYYLQYFFDENHHQSKPLVPRQVQLPTMLTPFSERTHLYRIYLGNRI